MAVIHIQDVVDVKEGNVEQLPPFVKCSEAPSVITILPGLTLRIDSDADPIATSERVCGWATIQLHKDSRRTQLARVYFELTSSYYRCPKSRTVLNGPALCQLIAAYLQKNFAVQVGLVYLTENWKVGGHVAARGSTHGTGEYLYYISHRCK